MLRETPQCNFSIIIEHRDLFADISRIAKFNLSTYRSTRYLPRAFLSIASLFLGSRSGLVYVLRQLVVLRQTKEFTHVNAAAKYV